MLSQICLWVSDDTIINIKHINFDHLPSTISRFSSNSIRPALSAINISMYHWADSLSSLVGSPSSICTIATFTNFHIAGMLIIMLWNDYVSIWIQRITYYSSALAYYDQHSLCIGYYCALRKKLRLIEKNIYCSICYTNKFLNFYCEKNSSFYIAYQKLTVLSITFNVKCETKCTISGAEPLVRFYR